MAHTETGGANLESALTDNYKGARLEDMEQSLPEMLETHTIWVATAGQDGERLDLSGFDLRGVEDLRQYPLTAIKAVGANFLNQDLRDSQIQSAILDRADMRDCRIMGADLRGSSLKNAMLSRADISDANLAPLKFVNDDGSEWYQRINLTGANLRYAILKGAILHDAILTGADLSYAILIECDLRRADLRGAFLDGADMSGALTRDALIDERYRPR